jgi:hypothetical protein
MIAPLVLAEVPAGTQSLSISVQVQPRNVGPHPTCKIPVHVFKFPLTTLIERVTPAPRRQSFEQSPHGLYPMHQIIERNTPVKTNRQQAGVSN